MRTGWNIAFLLLTGSFFVACSNIASTELPILKTNTDTPGKLTPTGKSTSTKNEIKTETPPACDPRLVDYCIEDGSFFLQLPISETGTNTVDRSYPYASTAGGTRQPHLGVEFYNPSGTPVLAAGNGIVVYAGDDISTGLSPFLNFYGNLVIIEHSINPQYLYSLYAHLSKLDVRVGQVISEGEKVGEVGSTGASIGSHLHFELRLDFIDYTTTLNPELWLKPRLNCGVIAMQFQDETGKFLHVRPNIQYFPERTGEVSAAWQPEPYSTDMIHANSWENVALGNLPGGEYRISYYWEGVLFERWVEVVSGKLTLVSFILH